MKNKLVIILALLIVLTGCGVGPDAPFPPETAEDIPGLIFTERVKLSCANQFVIDRYKGGYSLIHTADGEKYLVTPEDGSVPDVSGIKIIKRPVGGIYMAATAAMSLFDALGRLDAVRFSSVKAGDWYIDGAKKAMERGEMLYAGKYSLPDYELLLSEGCGLSVQSTMTDHAPEVREKLEELGITVFVDRSSYESHPLGRCEWIKLYGEILGESELAAKLFEEQSSRLAGISSAKTGKTAVCFYISGGGRIVTRKAGDYVSKMIELAGGENILSEPGEDNALSTVAMEPEEFYSKAKDADVIIYDGAVTGEIGSVGELAAKNRLLADFKAVKSGDVWCTDNSFFQDTVSVGDIIADFNKIFSGDGGDLSHLHKLKGGDAP